MVIEFVAFSSLLHLHLEKKEEKVFWPKIIFGDFFRLFQFNKTVNRMGKALSNWSVVGFGN
jgi:hypothetical protein